jgi:dTDP-4-dehydrorhamnose reductase
MRIAVTGAGGRLGSELTQRRGCIPIESDILDFDGLKAELERIAPDVVINTAAYTAVDGAEEESEKAIKANVRGAGNVRIAFSGHLIHLSTSYVFDGTSKKPYKEDDAPGPIGSYAWSKWGSEAAVFGTGHGKPTLVVRTVNLYGGPSPKGDFVTKVLDQLRYKATGPHDYHFYVPGYLYSTPTYIPQLAQGLIKAAEMQACGLLHIAGQTPVSRLTWAAMIAEEWDLDKASIEPDPGPDPLDFRPQFASLDTSKAKKLGIPLGYLKDGLRRMHADENKAH